MKRCFAFLLFSLALSFASSVLPIQVNADDITAPSSVSYAPLDSSVSPDATLAELRALVLELKEIYTGFGRQRVRSVPPASQMVEPRAAQSTSKAQVRITTIKEAPQALINGSENQVSYAPLRVISEATNSLVYEKIESASAESTEVASDAAVAQPAISDNTAKAATADTAATIAPAPGTPNVTAPTLVHAPAASVEECTEMLKQMNVKYSADLPSVEKGQIGDADFAVKLEALGANIGFGTKGNKINKIMDCRLAVALSKAIMSVYRHPIKSIEYISVFRENAHVRGGETLSGHAKGLAIDVSMIKLDDDTELSILKDWGPVEPGVPPCETKFEDESSKAAKLRSVVCEIVEEGVFNVLLTPNFDQAHANHLHLEVRPDVNWVYLR